MSKRLAVIGGGASGVISAIEAKNEFQNIEITIFERLPKLCKKILVTGNGRCNYTNEDLSPGHFYGDNKFLRAILTSVYADSENYFRQLGVLSYHEDGRIYPRSQQSATIRDALVNFVEKSDIKVKLETPVNSLKKQGNGYLVNGEYFDAVIVSGGGKSASVHGSDGSCFNLLEMLGHTKTELYPALCGLVTNEKNIHILKGVRAKAKAQLFDGDKLLGEDSGEIQFTDKAVSGIPVMNLSHLCKANKTLVIKLDLCEEFTEAELTEHFAEVKRNMTGLTTESVLCGLVNQKLGFAVINKAGIPQNTNFDKLNRNQINSIISVLKSFEIPVIKTKDFADSQITCGGIIESEIDPLTMMSEINKGLFICGEIINIHGDCGGYNLHLAWTTGRIAGSSAAKYLKG